MVRWWLPILMLVLWGTRIAALESLPLHNDEGLHLTRAVEVWNGHPFWAISDGKIINHWLIAAFYPQNAPVFTGRIATVLLSLLGLAAGYRLLLMLFGETAAILGACLWIASPYLFFYERLALSDAEAGALVVLTLWASVRLTRRNRWRDGILAGLMLVLAMLFKFTAAPFALMLVIVVLLLGRASLTRRFSQLAVAGLTVAICFTPPLIYLLVSGSDFFSIALQWLGGGESGPALGAGFGDNAARLWIQLTGFGLPIWAILLLVGLAVLALTRQVGRVLLAALGLPLLIMMVAGTEVLPRHYVVALPLALLLAGAGLSVVVDYVKNTSPYTALKWGIAAVLLLALLPFAMTAYLNPSSLPIPPEERRQYITEHSGGFGLREAILDFPRTIVRLDFPIIGSMFPDGCKRANFYAAGNLVMTCQEAPGHDEIQAALDGPGGAYVLTDSAPIIGLDVTTLNVQVTRIAAYPRPGETPETATVVLWLLETSPPPLEVCSPETVTAGLDRLPAYVPSDVATFVTIQGDGFVVGDTPFPVRGVNYYPARYPWRRFLTEAKLDDISRELALLRDTGFNSLRLFLWNEALFPCEGSGTVPLNDAFLRLDAVIHEAAAHDFRLIITLNDMPDLAEYPLYLNPEHIQRQTRFIVERYRDEAAIMAWDLRNEGDIDYGSQNWLAAKFSRLAVLGWLADTSAFVRELDERHLITAGWLHDSQSTIPAIDFVSFHHWDDSAALSRRILALRDYTDRPILLEEFGYSTYTMTPEEQSRHIQQVIETAESQNLAGWLVWTAFDFPLDATCAPSPCLSADNAEHHFGLWYADYTPKPSINHLQTILAP